MTTYIGASSIASAEWGPAEGTFALGSGGYGTGTSTASPNTIIATPTVPTVGTPSDPVTTWLQSPESRQYEGRWVVLDDQCNVIADAPGPEGFAPALVAHPGNTMLFVLPAGVRISG